METNHTFPLPETETSKLQEVTEQLRKPRPQAEVAGRYSDWVRANRWTCILAGLALGFLIGKSSTGLLPRR